MVQTYGYKIQNTSNRGPMFNESIPKFLEIYSRLLLFLQHFFSLLPFNRILLYIFLHAFNFLASNHICKDKLSFLQKFHCVIYFFSLHLSLSVHLKNWTNFWNWDRGNTLKMTAIIFQEQDELSKDMYSNGCPNVYMHTYTYVCVIYVCV